MIQNGENMKQTHIMLTSKKLMSNCEKKGMFHIDGTYKLVKNHFPVVVLGITDLSGKFHPIAFCITSHEDTICFTEFYSGLLDLAGEMGIDFDPDFIMQDSWDASYVAASKAGLKATILMCYFHVIYNVKKLYKHKLEIDEWHELRSYLNDIHLSRSEQERDLSWDRFEKKYQPKKKTKKGFAKSVYEYVKESWYDSRYNKWMIYHTPPGFGNTNSPIESFNATIKRDFFLRKRLSVLGCALKIEDIIKYYSSDDIKFNKYPKFVEATQKNDGVTT